LSKKQAKLLGSRLKKVKSSPPRYWSFCNDVFSVNEALGHQHYPNEWCLLILQKFA
jgi:hypothetical protein